jgi:Mrp family chromosome partitioning ATPase/capsular polysaccharide biosynthesis protein
MGMTVDCYRTTFVKQWKAMLLCFLSVVLGVFLISKGMTPIYQVSAIMQVTPQPNAGLAGATDGQNIERLVQTEAQLALSESVLREVASREGMTLEQLMRRTSVTPKSGTQLFEISVQDASSIRAAALANDIAQTLLKQQSTLTSQASSRAAAQIQQDLASTQQQIDALLAQIAEQQGQNKKSGQLLRQISEMQTQLTGWQQHYNQLQEAWAALELMDAQNSHTLQIVQLARPGGVLVRPNLALNLLASLPVALSLSILLALALELWSYRIRTPEALSQLLQWPILALVWRVRGYVERDELVHLPDQEALSVEAYHMLRTNLAFSCIDRSVRTFLVTSAGAGEGKSVVAANLAISLARVGKNTLLIDADLRCPVLHELFSIDADKMGLSDAILTASAPDMHSRRVRAQFLMPLSQGNTLGLPRAPRFAIDSFVHDTGIANLRIMPAGTLPPNPLELLESRAMQRLFIALEQSDVDVIIFDTPPLLQIPDASILSARVDGTLVVVDAGRARRGELKQLKAVLAQSGAHVLGCVMNRLRPGSYNIETSYAHTDLQEEEPSEEPCMSPGAAIASVSIARMQMLSAGRGVAHAALPASRRSIHRRSRR